MAANMPSSTGGRSHVDFYFDPTCPYTYRVSRWLREVAQVRPVEIEFKFLSLLEANRGNNNPPRETHVHSYATFPLLAKAREQAGNAGVDRLYLALGQARHEQGESLGDPAVVDRALTDAGFDPAWRTDLPDRPALEERVLAEHRDAVDRLGAFAVPTLSIDGGKGVFGPVLTAIPTGEDAGELWDHFSYLVRRDDVFEFKKPR
jgi:2-hydroxychromene-2-carboxylate isomerase